jgi:hypothetical protein
MRVHRRRPAFRGYGVVVSPRRGYAWTERGYPGNATQFDFGHKDDGPKSG